MPVSSLAVGKAEVAKLDFSQEEMDRLKAKLLELTEAKIIVRSPQRDANGKCVYVEVPNVGIQLAATVKAIEFGVGKPRQMVEVSGPGGSGQAPTGLRDLAKLMAEQPDIAAKVIGALKDGIKVAQAIDVTATSAGIPPAPAESKSESSPSERP